VPFVRGPHRWSLTLYYDTAGALRQAGVPLGRQQQPPRPAPAGAFAPPPPGRR
jgi:hypothetical protein